MHADVEIVKSRTNIVDVVGEYVKLTKAGNNFKARCPFHQEKTPSFTVSEEKQFYHCFGCGKGGDVFSFVMEMEGIGFREALTMLAQKAGVELQNNFTQGGNELQGKKKKLYEIVELTAKFYEKQLWTTKEAKDVLAYLHSRGLDDKIIKKFRLGYAPDGWNNVENFLHAKGFTHDIIVQTGSVIKSDKGTFYDRFRKRIIFPITDVMGKVIGFTARALPGDDEAQAKYINTPETMLYHKSAVLYGIDHAKQVIKQRSSVVVVEGNMDVIAAHMSGIQNTIAVSGTAMTQDHITVLRRYTDHFILFFDADEAGRNAARRSAMLCFDADVQVAMVLLTEGKDAADIARDNPQRLQQIIKEARRAIDVFIDIAKETFDTTDPHGKRQAVEFVAEIIAHVISDIERNEWIVRCANSFFVEERFVRQLVEQQSVLQSDNVIQKIDKDSQKDNIKKSQTQRIYKSIILMMMAYPHVWEYVYENRDRYDPVMKQRMIAALIREGPDCQFSVGEFVRKDEQREELYKAAMKMQQKYETEHEDGGSPIEDTQAYITNALEIINKKKINRLVQKMNKAEANGDYDAQKKFLEEINTISQQLIRNT